MTQVGFVSTWFNTGNAINFSDNMIKKKKISVILLLLILSAATIIILFLMSRNIVRYHNSFTRILPPHPVTVFRTVKITSSIWPDTLESYNLDGKSNVYYIAGFSDTSVFIANVSAPLFLFEISKSSNDRVERIKLNVKDIEKYNFNSIQVTVDSPYFYVADGTIPKIFRGCRHEQLTEIPYINSYFNEFLPIGYNSVFLKSISGANMPENILLKNSSFSNPVLASNVLEKQVDGLFCTDGSIHYNKNLNYLIYLYQYRNQFICIDTNLNLAYRGRTIDTIAHAQVNVYHSEITNQYTLASPPLVVNKNSCVAGNLLFVNSNLSARNESLKMMEQASVIDVYDLRNGAYTFSFYIYNVDGEKMSDFKVHGDQVVSIHGSNVVLHKIAVEYAQ